MSIRSSNELPVGMAMTTGCVSGKTCGSIVCVGERHGDRNNKAGSRRSNREPELTDR